MKYEIAIAATDAVNKYGMKIEDGAFINNLFERGDGISQCIAHDMHRPIGWVNIFGVLIEPKLSSLVVIIESPENDSEYDQIKRLHQFNIASKIAQHAGNAFEQLCSQLNLTNDGSWKATFSSCAFIIKENIARYTFGNIFEKEDKDGLIRLSDILAEFDYLGDGVFAHKTKDFALFAHTYFRRRLSYVNSFRIIFLDALISTYQENDFNAKIRLDSNLIGWKHDFKNTIELEYWYGPNFNDDIPSIANVVTRHEASESEKLFELLDWTEFFWYSRDQMHNFECEEIIREPSLGVSVDKYGCRYIHSMYSYESRAISHFDAAIRMYNDSEYIDRLGKNLIQAGKNTEYTKLFRMDGLIPVSLWKKLCVLYMQGNSLVSEYFGIKQFEEVTTEKIKESLQPGKSIDEEQGPVALISLAYKTIEKTEFCEFDQVRIKQEEYSAVIDCHAIELLKIFRTSGLDLNSYNVLRLSIPDKHINFPTLNIAPSADYKGFHKKIIQSFCTSLQAIHDNFSKKTASISIAWSFDNQTAKLAIVAAIPDIIRMLIAMPHFPITEENFLNLSNTIHSIADEMPALQNGAAGAFLDLPGNLRKKRNVVPSEYIEKFDPEIVLTPDGFEYGKQNRLEAKLGTLISSSNCSVCQKKYSECEHHKFSTDGCYEEVTKYRPYGIFWCRNE